LNSEEVIDQFRATGALLEGHFQLSSGLHSTVYLQCALVLQFPDKAEGM
jgi:orotate phosphoribosyltransferase